MVRSQVFGKYFGINKHIDSPERRATGQVAELVDANTCGKYAEQGEQH